MRDWSRDSYLQRMLCEGARGVMKSLDCFVVALNLGVPPLQDVLRLLVSTVSKDTITDSEYADIVESMLFRISSYSTLSPASNEPLAGAWKLTVTYGRGRKVRKEACRIRETSHRIYWKYLEGNSICRGFGFWLQVRGSLNTSSRFVSVFFCCFFFAHAKLKFFAYNFFQTTSTFRQISEDKIVKNKQAFDSSW